MKEASEKGGKLRLNLRTSDKVILGVVILLAVLILALGLAQRFGLLPINGALVLQLPLLAVVVLLGWGAYALIRRIKRIKKI